jgi:hypothetical protein
MTTFMTTIFREDDAVEVCVDYDATYQAARIYGPPEDCYPEYGEMVINSVTDSDGGEVKLSDADEERIEEQAWEHYHTRGVDDYE